MNDELSGQLTSSWHIPEYAQDTLWLETDTGICKTEGVHGLFEMQDPTQMLTLRWGGEVGPALVHLNWEVDNLNWDGKVRVGGYVDAIHLTEISGLSYPISVIYVGGQPLKQTNDGYPDNAMRKHIPYPAPDFYSGLEAEIKESVTTWLIPDGSPLARVVYEALMNNLRLHFFGRLADNDSGWGNHFALPLLLQEVTLFGP